MSSRRPANLFSIAVSALFIALIAGCGPQQEKAPVTDTPAATATPTRDSVTVVLNATDSTSVFELLRVSHQIDYQSSAMGVFVKGIDSVYGSSDAYWVYSVNDSLPEIASDKYTVRAGDIVKWHLRRATQ